MIKNREMRSDVLNIQQKCELRIIEQLQGKQKINIESKDSERLLKVAILKTVYISYYNSSADSYTHLTLPTICSV